MASRRPIIRLLDQSIFSSKSIFKNWRIKGEYQLFLGVHINKKKIQKSFWNYLLVCFLSFYLLGTFDIFISNKVELDQELRFYSCSCMYSEYWVNLQWISSYSNCYFHALVTEITLYFLLKTSVLNQHSYLYGPHVYCKFAFKNHIFPYT